MADWGGKHPPPLKYSTTCGSSLMPPPPFSSPSSRNVSPFPWRDPPPTHTHLICGAWPSSPYSPSSHMHSSSPPLLLVLFPFSLFSSELECLGDFAISGALIPFGCKDSNPLPSLVGELKMFRLYTILICGNGHGKRTLCCHFFLCFGLVLFRVSRETEIEGRGPACQESGCHLQDRGRGEVEMAAVTAAPAKYEKSYFNVLGICCPLEVPLVEKLLEPLARVQKVIVAVPSRMVVVVHDADTISQSQIRGEKIPLLVGIVVVFIIHVFGVYWWYKNDDLVRLLVMLPSKEIPPFWHAIFFIAVNDPEDKTIPLSSVVGVEEKAEKNMCV